MASWFGPVTVEMARGRGLAIGQGGLEGKRQVAELVDVSQADHRRKVDGQGLIDAKGCYPRGDDAQHDQQPLQILARIGQQSGQKEHGQRLEVVAKAKHANARGGRHRDIDAGKQHQGEQPEIELVQLGLDASLSNDVLYDQHAQEQADHRFFPERQRCHPNAGPTQLPGNDAQHLFVKRQQRHQSSEYPKRPRPC